MTVTRRLCISVICLVLSLAFCVWAVFAWFATKNDVRGEGISTSVLGPDIKSLTVERYTLDRQTDGSYLIGEKLSDSQATMPEFDLKGNETTTAVLIKLILTLNEGNIAFDLSVACQPGISVSGGPALFGSSLSNAVNMVMLGTDGVTASEGVPSKVTLPQNYTKSYFVTKDAASQYVKTDSIGITEKMVSEGANTFVTYIFMDYDSSLILDCLYPLIFENNGGFSSNIDFQTDISFTVEQTLE